MKKKKTTPETSSNNDKAVKKEGFLERGNKGHDSHNMGNDISGEIKIANSNGEMEGGNDKTWHMDEGK
jgi:hypothetical protein